MATHRSRDRRFHSLHSRYRCTSNSPLRLRARDLGLELLGRGHLPGSIIHRPVIPLPPAQAPVSKPPSPSPVKPIKLTTQPSLGISYKEAFKSLDYLGAFLFIGGAVPFLMGIVWAGVYDSNDVHVVAPLVVGAAVLICFALWESFAKLKYPLTPTYIFASSWGRDFTAPVIALGVVNMFYYSSSILWPQMITVFYTNGGSDWKYSVILSLPQGFAIFFGAILLTCFGSTLRHWHWQLTGSVFVMVVFGSLLGIVTPTNKGTMIAFIFLSQAGFGWALYLSIAITQMGVEHKNLGVSGGISGCIRFAAGAGTFLIYCSDSCCSVVLDYANPIFALSCDLNLPNSLQ